MNGRQIEIFHMVMKLGTVTGAAERLGITQPAVTASLQQTESILGIELFHRTGGRLHPTDEARVLDEEAGRIQDSIGVFRTLANQLKKSLASHLRISTPPIFAHALVPKTVARFVDQHPECVLNITTQHHEEILNSISRDGGPSDLGFTLGVDSRPRIGATEIGKVEIVALIPARWSDLPRSVVSVTDLYANPIIGTFPGEPLGNAVEDMLDQAGIANHHNVRVHNHSVAANLVADGVGATIIDSITARFIKSQNNGRHVRIIPLKDAPKLSLTAVFAKGHRLNTNARAFMELFRRELLDLRPAPEN
jgi:DNA-binding transcriptional LysR family regulator